MATFIILSMLTEKRSGGRALEDGAARGDEPERHAGAPARRFPPNGH
jgi:hypothetical protein